MCMGVATGAISAGVAVIRRQSLREQSWKQPSCRLPSGSKPSIWWGTLKQAFFTLPHEKVGRIVSYCMVASQQDYASAEKAGEILCTAGKGSAG